MTIKLYMDYISQPSRAVLSLLLLTKTPYQIIQTRISKHQNLTLAYLNLNPISTVPFIQDTQTSLKIAQSHAIMKYICRKSYPIQKKLYPIDNNIKLAKIDEYLDFHLGNTRKCHHFIFNSVFAKKIKLINADKQFIQAQARKNVDKVLSLIQKYFFKEGQNSYITGNQLTLADLSAYFQIEFLLICNESFSKWPIIHKWLKKMQQIQQIKQANKVFLKLLPRMIKKQQI